MTQSQSIETSSVDDSPSTLLITRDQLELHPDWDGWSSPWVVAVTFGVLRDNIDRVRARLSPETVP